MFLDNRKKGLLTLLAFLLLAVNVFAVPSASEKFLEKANEAFEEDDIETAYKYITSALKLSDDDANIIYFAQTIYKAKLDVIAEEYDPLEFLDVQTNLEKYPQVSTTAIKKLIKKIELQQEEIEKEESRKKAEEQIRAQKEQLDAQREQIAVQKEQMAVQKEQTETAKKQADAMLKQSENAKKQADAMLQQTATAKLQADAMKEQAETAKLQADAMKEQAEAARQTADVMKEQVEATKQSNQELINKLDNGLKDLGEGLNESAATQKRSTKVIAICIIGISLLILLIIVIIACAIHKGFKQQQLQQESYVQAFKMIAATQSQTNRIMLGGVTDVYGNGAPLRLAGSSHWSETVALPDVEFSKEDEEELQKLAVKCEEVGAKIDQITGRKNNSKNVSELVYKLSMQLGLTRGLAMVNFCAAMVYDAGFLAIDPDLMSAENLTPEQRAAMKEHVNLAEKYLEFVPKKYWKIFENASTMHHENMDGTGYPKGLKGSDIPQIARLIRVAESFISLSSKRNYRQAMDKESAITKLKEQPDFYDPMVVEVLESIV